MSEYFIEEKSVDQLFPSLLFKGKLNDVGLCDNLEQSIMTLWENKCGPHVAKDKFISNDNIHELPEFQNLVNIILIESDDILNFLKVKRDSHFITTMWANVTSKDDMHMKHIHPNSFLSGIFYVKTPIGCGTTVFSDPRSGSGIINPDYHERNIFNSSRCIINPERGNMLFWQSWLPHSVERASTNEDHLRISIAFNIMIKGQATALTEKYKFD